MSKEDDVFTDDYAIEKRKKTQKKRFEDVDRIYQKICLKQTMPLKIDQFSNNAIRITSRQRNYFRRWSEVSCTRNFRRGYRIFLATLRRRRISGSSSRERAFAWPTLALNEKECHHTLQQPEEAFARMGGSPRAHWESHSPRTQQPKH